MIDSHSLGESDASSANRLAGLDLKNYCEFEVVGRVLLIHAVSSFFHSRLDKLGSLPYGWDNQLRHQRRFVDTILIPCDNSHLW